MTLLLLLALTTNARAIDPAAAVIEKAQALAMARNRVEAARVMRAALEAPGLRTARPRLRESLIQISRVFFTDKGQRAFEAGSAVLFESPDSALDNLRAALALEDGNVTVRVSLAKTLLFRDDCAGAAEHVAAARALDPVDAEVAALELRVMVCENEYRGLREKIRALPTLDKWQESFVAYVQAREALRQNATARAIELLGRVTADFPRFPEARYYLARAESQRTSGGGEDALRKYVGLCKALTGRERREFALEPRACAHQKEAEDELAKKSVDL